MIDTEIRQVVEVELRDGEALLWAERKNHEVQNYHKLFAKLTPRRTRYLKIFILVAVVALPLIVNYFQGVNQWGTPLQIFTFRILSYVFLLGGVIAGFILILKFFTLKGQVYRVGAYALTDKRLFEFDRDLKLIRHLDASRLQHVYGTDWIVLKPIGSKWSRGYQVGSLTNHVLTANYLRDQIAKARKQPS